MSSAHTWGPTSFSVADSLRSRAIFCRQWPVPSETFFRGLDERHAGLEIGYCQSGTGTITVGGQTVEYKSGQLVYFQAINAHRAEMSGRYLRWGLCYLPEIFSLPHRDTRVLNAVSAVRPSLYDIRLFHVPESVAPRLSSIFSVLSDETSALSPDYDLFVQLRLVELHLILYRLEQWAQPVISCESTHAPDLAWEVVHYIDENLSTIFSVEQLADRFHYSRSQLSRVMKRATGRSAYQYLREKRFEKARRLLNTTELPIKDVAEAVGLPNIAYFFRAFREEVGMTPKMYREQCRSTISG